MTGKKWTPAQNDAISLPKCDLLVSASAGAGKTSVMIERIAQMLENGTATPADILVLTFTNEAARNMKTKLAERLGDKFDLSLAAIGTFHKFCGDIIQTYFSIAGINPSYAVLDEGNAAVLHNDILDAIIQQKYANCTAAIDAFCTPSSTKSLKDIVTSIATFLDSRDNADGWLEKNAFAGYRADLCNNVAMQGIINHFGQAGKYLTAQFAPGTDWFNWAVRLAAVKTYIDLHNISLSFDRLKPMGRDNPEYTAKETLNDILKKIKKQYILTEAQITANQDTDRTTVSQVVTLVSEYIKRYTEIKTERNFLDFADLERYALQILNQKQTGERVREKYKYIFVDEYQDTNPIQEQILLMLAGTKNMFVVGDVKQSIYGFRGTEVTIFTDRMEKYDVGGLERRVIRLNENFRSRPQILDFVNRVFDRIMRPSTAGIDYSATSRFTIEPFTPSPDTVETIIFENGTNEHEAAFIAEKITKLHEQGTPFSDIAVLARNSTHFDVLLETLRRTGIPCITDKKQNANELYEIALLNNMLFAVTDATYQLPNALLMQSFIFNYSADQVAQIKLGNTAVPGEYLDFQTKYGELSGQKSVADVLSIFIAEYSIIDKLSVLPDGGVRVRNIYNFLNKLRGASYATTVQQYLYLLEHELLEIQIESSAAGQDCVRIMTIHGSKGLEFPVVFLYDTASRFSSAEKRTKLMVDKTCGMCVYNTDPDDLVKHTSIARLGAVILGDRVQIAEEMRLLYVALTRAEQRLYITGYGSAYEGTGRTLDDFEILGARNYLDFLRPTETIPAQQITVITPTPEQQILAAKPDVRLTAALCEKFARPYPHPVAVNLGQKSSVTSLTRREEEFIDMKPRKMDFCKDRGAEYGTRFHKAMQSGVQLDAHTRTCSEIIEPFLAGMTVYRELMFLQTVERDGESILVQGVIDLLAVEQGGKSLIIDYKTTNASQEELVALYGAQLEMYAAAVGLSLGHVPEKYLYSTVHKKLIKL